jgi:glycosyltransferase involved in cell wall biosynthesis
MKICFVSSSFPRKYPDHIAPWFRPITQEFLKRGHSLSVFVPAYRGNAQTEYEGAEVCRFRYAPERWERLTHEDSSPAMLHSPLWKLVLLSYVVCGSLRAAIYFSRRRFDVIDVHWPFPQAVFGIIGKLLTGAKLVYHFYASEILLIQRSFLLRKLFALMMPFADEVIAISGPTKDWVETMIKPKLPVKVVYLGNTLPYPDKPSPHNPDFTKEPLRLFYAGKLIERLGPQYLLEAARILKEKGADFRLAVAGTGYLHDEIAAKIKAYGLEKNVELLGFIYKERLAEEYLKCHIFIFPSVVDSRGDTTGLGMVAMDALFYARPVIASEVGGVVDIVIDGKTGYRVPQKDTAALAAKILQVRDNYAQAAALALKGRRYAEENFSWDAVTSHMLSVFSGGANA